MDKEKNKAIAIEMLEEVFNKQNPEAVDKYYTADFVNHDPNLPQIRNQKEFKQWIQALKTGFPLPYYRTVSEDYITESDQVVSRWTCDVTGKGEYFGLPPMGRQIIFSGITIFRFVGGKIAECWWSYDNLGALQQAGLIPKMGQG
jgi:predicted SnoaL-like aldol condensation-catalyzing enzyme